MNVLIRILSALSLVGTLTVNALANILPLGGIQTGEVAWKYDNLFVPAGFTFSIWGVIYLLLIIFCVRFFFAKTETVRRLAPWFIASNLLNMGWMFAWHHLLIGLSLALMLALLASLIGFYLATRSVTSDQPGAERLGKRLPASVYLGWITVATIANASAFLTSVGWNGFGLSPEIWYGVVIGAAPKMIGIHGMPTTCPAEAVNAFTMTLTSVAAVCQVLHAWQIASQMPSM